MRKGFESKGVPPAFADEWVQAWMDEHALELEETVSGHRILYTSLVISFVIGLATHIAGYALLSSSPREPFGLLADLLHSLGWSLWTGVVVVVFIQIIPETKRRQIRTALEAYKALQRDMAQSEARPEGEDEQV